MLELKTDWLGQLATDCTPLMKMVCHNKRSLQEENAKITLNKIWNKVRVVRGSLGFAVSNNFSCGVQFYKFSNISKPFPVSDWTFPMKLSSRGNGKLWLGPSKSYVNLLCLVVIASIKINLFPSHSECDCYCCVFYNSDWQQQRATYCISLKKASNQGIKPRQEISHLILSDALGVI